MQAAQQNLSGGILPWGGDVVNSNGIEQLSHKTSINGVAIATLSEAQQSENFEKIFRKLRSEFSRNNAVLRSFYEFNWSRP